MKKNDYFALNLNLENTGVNPEDLRIYNITPDNTGLEDADYYKNIPQVIQRFSKDGQFDEASFNDFYKSVKRSYSKYASDDYLDKLINEVPTSSTDIFSLGNVNIEDDTAYMIRAKDPNRHQVGIGNLFQKGAASFSEREVAQANKVLDENGNQLDWSPNDRGGIRALFRPALALAEWKEGETSIENGVEVVHHAGERKYDKNGDPMYQILGDNEVYGRTILHFSDTLTKEGTFWNKLDIFDNDGLDASIIKLIARTAVEFAAFMSPAGPYLGALEAARALSKTIPTLTKQINGFITNDNENTIGKAMTRWENWASQFDRSVSDKGSLNFWNWESIGNQLVDSVKQLYSQNLIQKIPYLLKSHPSIKEQKIGQLASILYMATTSAQDVYGEYKKAGVSDRFAGIASLATMGAFFGFMNNEYFKTFLFSDPTLELPELRKMLKAQARVSGEAYKNTVKNIANAEGVKITENEAKLLAVSNGAKWYNKVYNKVAGIINKIPNSSIAENPYIVRGFNEGLEEVMEEGATDLIKGLTLGLDSLGFNVKEDSADDIDFGFSPQDFVTRYLTSFVGGTLGGAVFEGLNQWNTRKIKSVSKLDLDEQLAWYLRNGYKSEIDKWIDRYEKKGRFGTQNLAMTYNIEQDGDKKSLVWDPASDKNIDQNSGIANLLRQRVDAVDAQLKALGPLMLQSDNEILYKAIVKIEDEAEKAGMSVEEYSRKNLRDPLIDFIKQTGVDRLILSDAAELQHTIMVLDRRIKSRTEELSGNTDLENRKSEELIKNDETLKIYKKDLNDTKKKLESLLSGSSSSEYLKLALFAGDSSLKHIYLSDKTDKNGKPTYFEDIKGWTRSVYNQSYDDLIKNSGEKNPDKNNQTDLEEYLNAMFESWRTATEDIRKIRGAYEIHKAISKTIDPIIKRQMSDYSGYKRDIERTDSIAHFNIDPEQAALNLTNAANELDAYIKENPNINIDSDEEYQRLVSNLKDASVKYRFFTPQRFLDNAFKSDSNIPNTLEQKTAGEVVDALNFLKDYYSDLNKRKIVSEFSDDVLERGVYNIIESFKMFDDSESQKPINFGKAVRSLINYANDIDDILNDVIDKYSEDDEVAERIASLNELLNNFNEENIAVDRSGMSLAENALNYVGDVLTPEQRTILEDKIKYANFANGILKYIHNDELLYSKFQKSSQDGLDEYNTLKESLLSLNDSDIIGNIDEWLDKVLFDGNDFINKINDIIQIKSEGIKTPILDWVHGLSTSISGNKYPLWDLLQRETKNLISKATVNQYVVDNPEAVEELKFLQAALSASYAILQGARNKGVNFYVNQLDSSEKLPEIKIPELFDVYEHDLNVLYSRVAALLDLHFKNHKSTIETKRETFIKNAPKFLKAIVDKETTEDTPLQKIFKDILDIDLFDEWNTINADRFDFNDITETNFNEFWEAFRQWMDKIHYAIENLDFEKASQNAKNIYKRNVSSKNDLLAFVLTSQFTDLWKFQNSEITNEDDSEIKNLDIVLFLGSVIGYNPKNTFSAMQAISEKTQRKPFWDQMLSIIIGFSQTRNRELFNRIVDNIYLQGKVEIENNDEISKENKQYLINRSLIHNAVFVDGASGTGKSTIVLLFIKEMNSIFPFVKSDGSNAVTKSMAIAKYASRAKALGNTLSLSGDNVLTLSNFISKYFRDINENDYEQNTQNEGYRRRIKSEVIKELRDKLIANNQLMSNVDVLNIYTDEIGLMSEADLQLLSTFAESGYINLIFAGDRMQRGYTSELDGAPVNSGITDVWMLSTPRLTTSVRANNYGMQKTLEDFESRLKILWDKWQETPWINGSSLKLDGITEFKPIFSETDTNIYGVGIVPDNEDAIKFLFNINGKKIGIITDNEDKYTKYASENVLIKNPDDVQGDEFDYTLIDIKSIPKLSEFDKLRYEYTILSRARDGVLIVESFGDIKTHENRADAASGINYRDENGEMVGDEIDKYKDWWNTLFANDVLGLESTPAEKADGNTSGAWEAAPQPQVKNPSPSNPPPGTAPSPKAQSLFNFKDFDEEEFKKAVISQGKNINIRFYRKTKQRIKDLEHYQKYYSIINAPENAGKLIDEKYFIDWLFNPQNISFFTEKSNQFSILSKLNATQEFIDKYLEFIRNFSLDYWSLSEEELKNKYSDSEQFGLKENLNDSTWHDFIDSFFAEVHSNGKTRLYAITDGPNQFIYFVISMRNNEGAVNYYSIPIAIINNGMLSDGWVSIKGRQLIPLVMLSSSGNKTKSLKEAVGKYAYVSSKGYIPKEIPPKDSVSDDERGVEVRDFAKRSLGHAHVIVSSTFNNEKARPENLLQPEYAEGSSKITHLDKTSLDSPERLMAVNRRFNVEQYYEYGKALWKLWHRQYSQDDLTKLTEYLNSYEVNNVYKAQFSDDDGERIKSFRKIQLLSNASRSNFVTAIIRWFKANENTENKANYWNFIDNFFKWVSNEEIVNYNSKFIQNGVSFRIYNDIGLFDEYYIFLSDNKNEYNIFNRSGEIVGTINSSDYFNIDTKGLELERIAKNILNIINDERSIYNYDDAAISKEIATGGISFGLTTKSIDPKDDKVNFFAPFDSDIIELIQNVYNDEWFKKFLEEDSIFKYGFLIGFAGTNDGFENQFWMHCDLSDESTDIIEVIPPTFTIDSYIPISDGSLPRLGLMNHKIETMNKNEIVVRKYKDFYGNITKLAFDTKFATTKSQLQAELGLDDIQITCNIINVIGIENNKLIIEDVTGNQYSIDVTKEQIDEFLNGMQEVLIPSDVKYMDETNTYSIVFRNDKYLVQYDDLLSPAKIVFFKNGNLILRFQDKIINFTGVSNDFFERLSLDSNWINNNNDDFYYYGSNDRSDVYYDSKTHQIRIISDYGSLDGVVESITNNNGEIIIIYKNNKNEILRFIINESNSKLYEAFNKLGQIKRVDSPKDEADKIFKDIKDKKILSDPLLNDNPNSWAIKYMEQLKGLYTWDGIKGKFINPKENQIIYAFIFSGSSIGKNNIINNLDNINIDKDNNTLYITIDGERYQYTYSVNRNNKYTFTPYTSDAQTKLQDMKYFLNSITDETIRNNILLNIRINAGDVNAYEWFESYNKWYTTNKDNAEIAELIKRSNELAESLSLEEICNL